MCLPPSVTRSRPKQMKIFLLTSARKANPIGHQTPLQVDTFILIVYTVVIDHLFANDSLATAAVARLT